MILDSVTIIVCIINYTIIQYWGLMMLKKKKNGIQGLITPV